MPTLPLLLVSWLIAASPTLELPGPGTTHWVTGSCERGDLWSRELTTETCSWLLAEVEGRGPFADLDLSLRGKGWEESATSHLERERLLIPVLGQERLTASVTLASSDRSRFRLGITPLLLSGDLEAGAATKLTLRRPARVQLWRFKAPREGRARVTLERQMGPGDPDLLVLDENMGLVEIGETPGDERLMFDLREGEERFVLVLLRGSWVSMELRVEMARRYTPGFRPSSLERFLDQLAKTPDQRKAVAALRQNPDFLRIKSYLESYPEGVPIRLRVKPGLMAHGVERFGTYSQGALTINPTIAGHRENVLELIDTLIHELIHAILSFPRAGAWPLAPDVSDSSHDPRLKGIAGRPLRRGRLPEPFSSYMESQYGPSASNPDEDYTDINSGSQRLIIKVVRDNLDHTKLGRETLVFENARARDLLERGAPEPIERGAAK